MYNFTFLAGQGGTVMPQLPLALLKLKFHHLAFTEDRNEYLFSLAERNPKRICLSQKRTNKKRNRKLESENTVVVAGGGRWGLEGWTK